MEWQKNRSAFIQDNNIRQRTETKAGNVKDFSVMVAFLQSHKIAYAEYLKKYESLSGRQKQSYYDKNADKAAMVQSGKEKQKEIL